MTARAPFTKANLKRAIEAARAAGLDVVAIKPDGSLITAEKNAAGVALESRAPQTRMQNLPDESADAWGVVAA